MNKLNTPRNTVGRRSIPTFGVLVGALKKSNHSPPFFAWFPPALVVHTWQLAVCDDTLWYNTAMDNRQFPRESPQDMVIFHLCLDHVRSPEYVGTSSCFWPLHAANTAGPQISRQCGTSQRSAGEKCHGKLLLVLGKMSNVWKTIWMFLPSNPKMMISRQQTRQRTQQGTQQSPPFVHLYVSTASANARCSSGWLQRPTITSIHNGLKCVETENTNK